MYLRRVNNHRRGQEEWRFLLPVDPLSKVTSRGLVGMLTQTLDKELAADVDVLFAF